MARVRAVAGVLLVSPNTGWNSTLPPMTRLSNASFIWATAKSTAYVK
jgi:hypothetical protein